MSQITFPLVAEETRVRLLQPPKGKVKAVLDTDTFNEIDDQFAVVYALLSPEKIDVYKRQSWALPLVCTASR